ncbi:hypothetical protein BD410DRAFT_414288 [Rickenella mellea]|uniref:Uncharacterized protein n=1 Tax=Rickenella mellea TaxID=50990 RepID=A0A4Y7QJA2_9AGAM|nr:hypothetical protein BD410DRAFT_414288 [Rickenella mellea]
MRLSYFVRPLPSQMDILLVISRFARRQLTPARIRSTPALPILITRSLSVLRHRVQQNIWTMDFKQPQNKT